ncbi:MAG: HPr family phosphocarrier protein [Deltaproteobacteria bacterium]|nr:HPr family phosphocarrier protein [Deltaproteobacteria bacterium]
MYCEKELTITNKLGLHARAAAQLVKLANRYSSNISIQKDKLTADGKSILGILTLAASYNTLIKVSCDGSDADECLMSIESLILNKFNEE